MSTVQKVAKRIEREVGLSRSASIRIAHKLNELAKSVDWATPVWDGRPAAKRARLRRARRRTGGKNLTNQ